MSAAFKSGAVMGFLLAGNGLLVLYLTILAYGKVGSFASACAAAGNAAILAMSSSQFGFSMSFKVIVVCNDRLQVPM